MVGRWRFGRWIGIAVLTGGLIGVRIPVGRGERPLQVVATLTNYGYVAQYIGGNRVEVFSIADGTVDPHFVKPKPSYAVMVSQADLFISTGLDLELWEPALLAKAGNARVMPGTPGYVASAAGISLLEKPVAASRAEGDIHIYGNPHIYTSPFLMKRVARNIAAGLIRIDPAHRQDYERNLQRFLNEIDRHLYGEELTRLFGGELLDRLVESGQLIPFLQSRSYRGKPLIEYLGGWLKEGLIFRNATIVCYHKNWIYFATLFGLRIANYVEPKPGIPPSPQHVARVVEQMRTQNIRVLLAAYYFDHDKVRTVAERAGAIPVIVPMGITHGLPTYFDVVDNWVHLLADVFTQLRPPEASARTAPASRRIGQPLGRPLVFGW